MTFYKPTVVKPDAKHTAGWLRDENLTCPPHAPAGAAPRPGTARHARRYPG
jgi:hypothetical protein